MRINKVRFLNQQHAVRAAETKTVQAAVSGLADMVAAFREAVAAKVTGAPTVSAAVSDLTEKVADIQVEAAKVAEADQAEKKVSEYSLYLYIGAAIFAVILGWLGWDSGVFGLASEKHALKKLDKLDYDTEFWKTYLKDKTLAKKIKAQPQSAASTTAVSNIDAIKAAAYLLENKLITQAQFEKMRDDIMGTK